MDGAFAGSVPHLRHPAAGEVSTMSTAHRQDTPALAQARRPGVRNTVIALVIFVVVVFGWTIVGQLVRA